MGPSYVVVAAITVALLYGSRWARLAAAADLAILVFIGQIFAGLSTLQVAAVGHATALVAGAAARWPAGLAAAARPAPPAGRPAPAHLAEQLPQPGPGRPADRVRVPGQRVCLPVQHHQPPPGSPAAGCRTGRSGR